MKTLFYSSVVRDPGCQLTHVDRAIQHIIRLTIRTGRQVALLSCRVAGLGLLIDIRIARGMLAERKTQGGIINTRKIIIFESRIKSEISTTTSTFTMLLLIHGRTGDDS